MLPRKRQKPKRLGFEKLESRRLLTAGVPLTVITHGITNATAIAAPAWVRDMATAIEEERLNLPDGQHCDSLQIGRSEFTAAAGPQSGNCPHFLVPAWDNNANGPDERTAITNKLFQLIHDTAQNSQRPIDLHFIGHGRGAVVNSDVLAMLNQDSPSVQQNIRFVQMTTLDPYKSVPHGDNDVVVPNIVDFADNYFQQNATGQNGNPLASAAAVNVELTQVIGEWTGRVGQDADHHEVHDWYHWTIDLSDDSSPTPNDSGLPAVQDVRSQIYDNRLGRSIDGNSQPDNWALGARAGFSRSLAGGDLGNVIMYDDGQDSHLFTVNLTDASTPVFLGTLDNIQLSDIAISPSGNVFGITTLGSLFHIHRSELNGRRFLMAINENVNFTSLEFQGDQLYAAGNTSLGTGGSVVFEVDVANATWTPALQRNAVFTGGDLAFDSAGRMYLGMRGGNILRTDPQLALDPAAFIDVNRDNPFGLIYQADDQHDTDSSDEFYVFSPVVFGTPAQPLMQVVDVASRTVQAEIPLPNPAVPDVDGASSYLQAASGIINPNNSPPNARVEPAYRTNEDTPLVVGQESGILANDTDPNDDTLTAILVQKPGSGTLSLNETTGAFTYTPNTNFNGTDRFTYRANDGNSNSNLQTVTINVTNQNDPPAVSVINDQVIAEDGSTGPISFTVSDPETPADALTVTATSSNETLIPLAHVVLAGSGENRTVTVAPVSNMSGTAVITVQAGDGTSTGTSNFEVIVNPVLDPPVAQVDTFVVEKNTQLVVAVADGVLKNDSDPDGDSITAEVLDAPLQGSLDEFNADGSFKYTPPTDFVGDITFTYRASDGGRFSAATVVTIHVVDSSAFAAVDDSFTVRQGSSDNLFSVLNNDTITPGTTISAIASQGSTTGTLTGIGSTSLTYTTDPTYLTALNGPEQFRYTIDNGLGRTAEAVITITVISNWRNETNRHDVNGDGSVTSQDALILIQALNGRGSGALPNTPPTDTRPWLDVNGDGFLSPIDVLLNIRELNRNTPGSQPVTPAPPVTPLSPKSILGDESIASNASDPAFTVPEIDPYLLPPARGSASVSSLVDRSLDEMDVDLTADVDEGLLDDLLT